MSTQTPADYDRIRDRDLNRHLDEKYGDDDLSEDEYQTPPPNQAELDHYERWSK